MGVSMTMSLYILLPRAQNDVCTKLASKFGRTRRWIRDNDRANSKFLEADLKLGAGNYSLDSVE
jgi:hypothetical protein